MPGSDPSKHRVLLVGPRVIHLKPFFDKRRYGVVAVQTGVEGMGALNAESMDIVVLELNLTDLTATEFLMATREAHAHTSFLLLDDASKAGQIVKALQAGLDGYLPTPPDEDRLFFEVERQLQRTSVGATARDKQVALRNAEAAELLARLAERDSRLLELGVQADLLNQEILSLRAQAQTLGAVRAALVGHIDGDLDEAQAQRLHERLAMASVLETEAAALREELTTARTVRRELQHEIEQLNVRQQEFVDGAKVAGSAVDGRARALEVDKAQQARRIAELADELAHKTAAGAQQQRELEDQLTRARSDHADALARLTREHDDALRGAQSDIEADRAHAIAAALGAKEREHVEERSEGDLEQQAKIDDALGQIAALQSERDAADTQKDLAVGAALDSELIIEELKLKIEYCEGEVEAQRARASKAESDFKKDKLRLIEEKEQVSVGSQQLVERLQRVVDDNALLKKANAELEAIRLRLQAATTP